MSKTTYNPNHIEPELMMYICNFNADELIDYAKDEDVNLHYNIDDSGMVYFTAKDAINFLYGYQDEDQKPNRLAEIDRLNHIEEKWSDIYKEAKNKYDGKRVHTEIGDVVTVESQSRKNSTEQKEEFKNKLRVCQVCGNKDTYSKRVCKKHYNKIYYNFDQVNNRTIEAYLNNDMEYEGWSREYDSCRECKTTTDEHHAKGYCKTCYYKVYHQEKNKMMEV